MSLLGYDPQRLLTDQRTHEKKLVDAMAEVFGALYDDLLLDAWCMIPTHVPWHVGGTVTGRWHSELNGRPPIQMPRDEYVIPRDRYRKD